MKKAFLTLLLMLTAAVSTRADYLFKTVDARDGLTSSQINCIMKDKCGYVWFGTNAGLFRYDGYVFKVFQSDSQDGSSLPDSYISELQQLSDHRILIKTADGYCFYNQQSESFIRDMKPFLNKIGVDGTPELIHIDSNKNIWVYLPKKKVACFNTEKHTLVEFTFDINELYGIPDGRVCSFAECQDGTLVVYDDGQLACIDMKNKQRVVWRDTQLKDVITNPSSKLRAYGDAKGKIWLYGTNNIYVYNKATKTWDTTFAQRHGITGSDADDVVTSLISGKNNNVWIGTHRHSLVEFDQQNDKVNFVELNSLHNNNTTNFAAVQCLYMDDTDLLWVGTEKHGALYWGKNIYKFNVSFIDDITAISQLSDGTVLYGTSSHGLLDNYMPLTSSKVTAIQQTKDGSIWVGSKENGLTRILNGSSTFYTKAEQGDRSIINNHINALTTDKAGNLWIGTDGGLQMYNSRMNSFSTYTRESGKLRTNIVTSLFYAKNNRMLIGTNDGLSIMQLSTTELNHYVGNKAHTKKFTNSYVTQVIEDSRGLIWVGTREGVNILNLENDVLWTITEKEGLCNNNICGIVEDDNHNIWVSTFNGITRIIVQRDKFEGESDFNYGLYNYNKTDGLQSNEFNAGAIAKLKDGKVLFGGTYGVNWVKARVSEEHGQLPTVILTQLFLGEEEVMIGQKYNGRVILKSALNETTRIELSNSQNTITIKFSAGAYNQGEKMQFQYSVVGLDGNWHNCNAMDHGITLEDLSSGKYTLYVKAISADTQVSQEVKQIEIVILRPWYLSWAMIALYFIVVAVAIYLWKLGIDQIKARRARKQAIITDLAVQREEMKKASDDLRQPMARMTSIIGALSEKSKSLEERELLNTLHSQMLLVITRVTDMQSAIENPEERAKKNVNNKYLLNSKGELNLPELVSDELTTDMQAYKQNDATANFKVLFIDDNTEFLTFVNNRLKKIYEFHPYDDILKAKADIPAMQPDVIVCKQDMATMTGSELCTMIKQSPSLQKIKFVIMTDGHLSQNQLAHMNIAMAADEFLAKPFNLQEAITCINRLLGIGTVNIDYKLIEGAETRMLEDRNSSMTTATEHVSYGLIADDPNDNLEQEMKQMEEQAREQKQNHTGALQHVSTVYEDYDPEAESTALSISMLDAIDQQLLQNIDQYVVQNMSRGQISLDDMANAMGMGRVPFFHRVRRLTGKTPTELVRDIRLKNACLLLKRTDINMNELAQNIGMHTGENFSKIFKDKFGLSPLEYRMKHRK